jgi:hypothetical protein
MHSLQEVHKLNAFHGDRYYAFFARNASTQRFSWRPLLCILCTKCINRTLFLETVIMHSLHEMHKLNAFLGDRYYAFFARNA